MNKKILLFLLPIIFLILINFSSAICSLYSYTSDTGGTDYLGITTSTNNETLFGVDQIWTGFTFFTPRLNFTVVVNESFTGDMQNVSNYFNWYSTINISPSLKIYNNSNLVDSSNYTVLKIGTNSWGIKWLDSLYNGTVLYLTFNKTFVKNVDDLVLNASQIYSGVTTNYFLTQNTITDYGQTKTFRFNGALLGAFINNTNWAVGWSLTNRTCIATQVDSGAYNGINSTKTTLFAAFGLLAVLLLAMAAFAVVQIFNGSGGDLTVISITVIGGGILLIIAFTIIYYVAKALIGI